MASYNINNNGAYNQAIDSFRKTVGSEWVFTSKEDLSTYRDPYSVIWDEPGEVLPLAAVAPGNVEHVQEIVRAANEHGVALYTISTGKNLGYGGASANLAGCVILDLKRMDRIIEVDDTRNFCIVEPGVSYFDLYRYLEARGLRLMLDLPSNAMGGPIGNSLDHGVGYSAAPYRDHFANHCGMEVVLANGEILRTGMGAVPGAETWAEFKYGFGPNVDGLFSQANYGVVTKMGFWLMPMPEHFLSASVSVARYEDIIPLVRHLNYLEDSGLVGFVRYSSPLEIPRVLKSAPDPALLKLMAQPGGGEPQAYEHYAKSHNLPFWTTTLNFYGPQTTNCANWDYARQRLASIPGVTFQETESISFPLSAEAKNNARSQVSLGVPNLTAFALGSRSAFNANPSDGHLWFSPVIPRSGEALLKAHKVFGQAFKDLGIPSRIGPYSGPRTWMYRAFVFVMDFNTSRLDKVQNQQVRQAFEHLIKVGAEHGWAEYRTAPIFQDLVASTYSYNNNALLRFNETLKDALDPKGILSPGRGGIWPKHLRGGH
ncbi:FAD-binding oxidoreductase [Pseudomonas hefeiensis]|uniref:FAD-binding oxidoreductase n=1 Tax=Pseudomonas hefeiensis TaxID=2738125 RepID=A0ABY9GGL4_9PSED|nr:MULTISPECIES: FAD-binding oxidoreductase [unclassified Pseudomonas]WLH14790.1 FAD-binding oxidoreductase [Pseudomonas sp. FP205]WLH97841.1 FAD-binding oxidoreductase [Pseudomonas sp. FP53]WLI42116.1 FAD-binding oxidoreductase [Pseudomonas sp. FP821]